MQYEKGVNGFESEQGSPGMPVYLLTAAVATIGANSLALGPIAAAISADLGETVPRTMYAAAGYGLGTAFSALALASRIDGIGAARALNRALVGLAAGFVICWLATGLPLLVAGQVIAGLSAGVALPAIYAIAAQISPPGRESTILGRVLVGWTISMVGGVSLAALVAELANWRVVFAGLAVLSAMVLHALSRSGHADPGRLPTPSSASPLSALRVAGVVPLLLMCLAYMIAFYGAYGFVGAHIHEVLGHPVGAAGAIAVSYGLGFGAASLANPIVDRYGVRRVLPFALVFISAVYVALAAGSGSYAALVAVSLVWGIANHFGVNLIVAGLSRCDPSRRGAILGLYSAVTYFAACLGALVFGGVYAAFGFSRCRVRGGAVRAGLRVRHAVHAPRP